jgi:hypothetical protein
MKTYSIDSVVFCQLSVGGCLPLARTAALDYGRNC